MALLRFLFGLFVAVFVATVVAAALGSAYARVGGVALGCLVSLLGTAMASNLRGVADDAVRGRKRGSRRQSYGSVGDVRIAGVVLLLAGAAFAIQVLGTDNP